jgi:hypothetical protein
MDKEGRIEGKTKESKGKKKQMMAVKKKTR